ncbi:PREDICTED: putative cysteine-rich repeat secretory protein 13 [Camelina sativa]|uniref:Cysteine-rich repeat secretory protein 13 n=1 Tax=Camelina sativa TaxID=90675 RepID=A0ABM0TT15_CAMSA|nr:PREDICTED: putative cysteine-rich repeat secretory protein 13 [Camelina sativa]
MSSNIFGWVPILAVVAIQLLLIRIVSSQNVTNEYLHHQCNNTQLTYRPGSTFEKNLNQVIRNITPLHLRYGYTYNSNVEAYKVSKDSNIVFVLLQCRGDSYGSKCHSCLHTALSGLRERCPGNRGAIIWYDQCVLEISTVNTEGRIRYDSFFNMTNQKNVSSDPDRFKNKRRDLFHKLLLGATKDRSERNDSYAVGETRIGKNKMYAMVQCALDLTPNSCHVCLE